MVLSVKHSPDCSPGKATSGQMSPTTGNTACLRTALLLQWSLNSLHRLATQGCPAHWVVKGGRMKGRKKKQTTPTAIVRGFTSASLTELLLITAAGLAGDAADLNGFLPFVVQ